jgi:hypothetical protein
MIKDSEASPKDEDWYKAIGPAPRDWQPTEDELNDWWNYNYDRVQCSTDTTPEGECSNEERPLIAVGPRIRSGDVAYISIRGDQYESEICQICKTSLTLPGSYVMLKTCLHLYHHRCLSEHLNGVSEKSNLCVRCGEKITEHKRKLGRPLVPLQVVTESII